MGLNSVVVLGVIGVAAIVGATNPQVRQRVSTLVTPTPASAQFASLVAPYIAQKRDYFQETCGDAMKVIGVRDVSTQVEGDHATLFAKVGIQATQSFSFASGYAHTCVGLITNENPGDTYLSKELRFNLMKMSDGTWKIDSDTGSNES